MIKILTLTAILATTGCSTFNGCDTKYVKIGAGYKFEETDNVSIGGVNHDIEKSNPISARFEGGYHCKKGVTVGVSHHSQWLTGNPVNNDWEYHKTELFVDKEWTF